MFIRLLIALQFTVLKLLSFVQRDLMSLYSCCYGLFLDVKSNRYNLLVVTASIFPNALMRRIPSLPYCQINYVLIHAVILSSVIFVQ